MKVGWDTGFENKVIIGAAKPNKICYQKPFSVPMATIHHKKRTPNPSFGVLFTHLSLPNPIHNHLHRHVDLLLIIPIGFWKEKVPDKEQSEDTGG
ncbi:hypothetical protein DET59_105153 [Rossellomorea aquimaris]|uniref:Uncharacterized protein n=1 Tax=Rossellomorea aquimaris TaxID=189382 RepID=A0A366ERD0_9BACI|nr:hypothetical protein DET59_105153 [Rossellomorea aquimaris]